MFPCGSTATRLRRWGRDNMDMDEEGIFDDGDIDMTQFVRVMTQSLSDMSFDEDSDSEAPPTASQAAVAGCHG